MTPSRLRFASASSAEGSGSTNTSARLTVTAVPFARAFSRAAFTAVGSVSSALTGTKPSFAAATARTPEPQPRSITLVRGRSRRSSRQSRVVACAPVPNAWPGSITTGTASASGGSQRGPIQRGPTRTGRWNRFQAVSQSSSTSAAVPGPNACQKRSSPAAFEYAASSRSSSCSTSSKRRPELLEESFVGLVVRVVLGAGKLVEEAPLLVRQVAGNGDVDEQPVIAPPEPLENGHTPTAQDADLARLCPGLEVEVRVAVERRDFDVCTERRLRHCQVDRGDDVVTVADEPFVRLDSDEDVGIACPPPEQARVALAGEPDALAVVNSGRDLDFERPLLSRLAAAAAFLTGRPENLAAASAVRARLGSHELAEDRRRHRLEATDALATRARFRGRDSRRTATTTRLAT